MKIHTRDKKNKLTSSEIIVNPFTVRGHEMPSGMGLKLNSPQGGPEHCEGGSLETKVR